MGFIHIQARWDRRACCPTVHRAVSFVTLPLPPQPPGDVLTSTGRPQALDEEAGPGVEAALDTDTNSGPGTHSAREPPSHSSQSPEDGRGLWCPLGKWPWARIGHPVGSPGPSLPRVTLRPVWTWPVPLGTWPPFSKDTTQGRMGGAPHQAGKVLPHHAGHSDRLLLQACFSVP